MNTQPNTLAGMRYRGPHLGAIAIIFTLLFNAGLYPVTIFGGLPHFPNPSDPLGTIAAFFLARPPAVAICAFFHFGSAISLGIFTAAVVSQLRFLGANAAGTNIAFFGGMMTAFNIAAGSLVLWVMAHPGIAQAPPVLNALYYLSFAFGGPGFSVPIGLLFAGISVTAAFQKLLPVWAVVLGIALAVIGELSWLDLITPKAILLIPLTRFPGFVFLIITGFKLPRMKAAKGQ